MKRYLTMLAVALLAACSKGDLQDGDLIGHRWKNSWTAPPMTEPGAPWCRFAAWTIRMPPPSDGKPSFET